MAKQLKDDSGAGTKGGGVGGFVIGLVMATLAAAVAGAGLGFVLGPNMARQEQEAKQAKPGGEATDREGKEKKAEFRPRYARPGMVVRLKPILANLRAPFNSWVRLEAAMLLDAEPEKDEEAVQEAEMLKAMIEQDITAWLRTLALKDLEGPSNFAFLHDDLTERARIRSHGLVREIVILTMVVE